MNLSRSIIQIVKWAALLKKQPTPQTCPAATFSELFLEAQRIPFSKQSAYIIHKASTLPISQQVWSADNLPDAPTSGVRVLIGVALWSRPDLELLDKIRSSVQRPSAERLDVLNIDTLRSAEEREKCVPGIGRFMASPLAAIWNNGELKEKGWGLDAIEIFEERYRLQPSLQRR